MNFGRIYQNVTSIPKKEEAAEEDQQNLGEKIIHDAARMQAKQSWQGSSITAELVNETLDEINTLIDGAINMAINYPSTNNHQNIIYNLVKVDVLRTQLQKYVGQTK